MSEFNHYVQVGRLVPQEFTVTTFTASSHMAVVYHLSPPPTVDEMLAALQWHIDQGLAELRRELGQA